MKKILAFILIARPLNVFIAFAGIFVAGLIAGATRETYGYLALTSLSGMLLGAGGNIINDIYDLQIDKINKPKRILPSLRLSMTEAKVMAFSCFLPGLIISFFISTPVLLIAIASTVLMFAYSAKLKRTPLTGNGVVALVTGAAFMYGSVAVGNPAAGIIPALFAILFNMGREIIKDIEDMEGDTHGGAMTYPNRYGIKKSLIISSVVLLLLCAGSLIPFLLSIYNQRYLWIVIFGVDAVVIAVVISCWKNQTKKNLHLMSEILKYDMLIGIASMYFGSG